jgi:hypothetical protein
MTHIARQLHSLTNVNMKYCLQSFSAKIIEGSQRAAKETNLKCTFEMQILRCRAPLQLMNNDIRTLICCETGSYFL